LRSWWPSPGGKSPALSPSGRLRRAAGDSGYQGDFIANWLHELLFIDATPQTLTILYSLFGGLVVLTLCLVPPRIPRRFRTTQPG
jgi:hypothetical protein